MPGVSTYKYGPQGRYYSCGDLAAFIYDNINYMILSSYDIISYHIGRTRNRG